MMREPRTANREPGIILALDVDTLERARYFLDKLSSRITIFKIGLQLFTAYGPKFIEEIHRRGGEVFLDLKFYDIPNTVANAVRQAVRLKVKMLTLHIAGGEEMLTGAVKAAKEEARRIKSRKPLLIGVTVLTSKEAKPREVLRLAKTGLAYGLDGIVCSAREAALLRKKIKNKFVIVTPGIRPAGAPGDDQKRAVTALMAMKAGSDFLVIGRPILQAKNPRAAAEEILGPLNQKTV